MEELSKRLINKSIEAFILGLEIYNKPTIRYRVEGFSFFICNSWELMLKAKLITENGESSIYYKDNKERTITLENCITQVFTNRKDPLRINIEKIIELRNTSTHFVTEDYEIIYAPLFQACIFNYIDKMSEFHNVDITEQITQTFLSLVVKEENLSTEFIKGKYPEEMAEKLLKVKSEISELQDTNNTNFSIDIQHTFYITKKDSEADAKVRIAKDGEIPIKILKEQKDPSNTHPYAQKNCLKEINKIIKRDRINFEHKLPHYTETRTAFNSNDFQLFLRFYDMKNNEHFTYKHNLGQNNSQYTYSRKTIEFIISEIKKDPQHIIGNLANKTKKER